MRRCDRACFRGVFSFKCGFPAQSIIMPDSLPLLFAAIDWSFWGVWTLTSVLMFLGLVGSVVPFIPGPLLILIGAVAHVLLRPESGAGWWCVALLFVLTLAAYALDFASGAMGTRWFGGSRWGIAGVLVGGIVGLFFGIVGLILGPLIGGFAFEMLLAQKELAPAMKSTWGTVVGTGVGLALRLGVAILMVVAFIADVVWH